MKSLKPTPTDEEIENCLTTKTSFSVVAGAGSGKTTSLISTLEKTREIYGSELRKRGQKVVCITYTKRAVGVIQSRLRFDSLYHVSTLHSFLWPEVARFQDAIRGAIIEEVIPYHLLKAEKYDNGGQSKAAKKARKKIAQLNEELANLGGVQKFKYEDSVSSNFKTGVISHDDLIRIATYLISNNPILRKGLGFKYPFIYVDEAQDTFQPVVNALNAMCAEDGLPLVGYFGDLMQQIYDDDRVHNFSELINLKEITKEENYRCSTKVIDFLNKFRTDVQQDAAGKNKDIAGSVLMTIVQADHPSEPRNRYSDSQLDDAIAKFNNALKDWGWYEDEDVKRLFLVRQMIARRLNFSVLQKLFTGKYSSAKSQNEYESGKHFLLQPFVKFVIPIVSSYQRGDHNEVISLFGKYSPEFAPNGNNKDITLRKMLNLAKYQAERLTELWNEKTTKQVLEHINEENLLVLSDKLKGHLKRTPRDDEYDDENEEHSIEKGDWLADEFFLMPTNEIENYAEFVNDNTAYSTQHGVKGEEYKKVVVVFDDIEAAWNNYSFSKLLTPKFSGTPTDKQFEKSRKLAYVCFSRAEEHLRILFYSKDAVLAKEEIIASKLLDEKHVHIL